MRRGAAHAGPRDISVLGLDPFRDTYKLQDRIGVQLQQAQLQKRIKVWEAVHLWASLYRRKISDGERLLEQLGLVDKRNAWFMTLSGGQKQRLFIVLALINDPELVFLDELTTGLDPQARRAIWELVRGIRERGKTVFLTTHLMEEAERLCDRVAIIEHGRLVDIDTPDGAGPAALSRTDRGADDRRIRRRPSSGSRAIPRVESVLRQDTRYTIRGRGDDFVTAVIQCLSEARITVTDFRTVHPTLEDVFLKLPATRSGTRRGRVDDAAADSGESDLARDQDLPARAARRDRIDRHPGRALRRARAGDRPRRAVGSAPPAEFVYVGVAGAHRR